MSDGRPVAGSFFFYAPNKGAPVFFSAAFTISGIVHLWQCIHHRCFKLTALFPFSCLFFTIGFALREYGAFHYDNLRTFVASTLMIYTPPPILQLANYHILGRIFYYVPYYAPMHPLRVLSTFGTLSCLVEVVNAIGISYMANRALPERLLKLGEILLKASLVSQVVVIALFFLLASIFHRRCHHGGVLTPKVKTPLFILYTSMFLLLARTVYRVAEHFSNPPVSMFFSPTFDPMTLSPATRYEWFFYVFEAFVMLVNMAAWNIWHPRRFLPRDKRVYLAQDGQTEVQGPGWKDEHFWDITCFDPLGIEDTSGRGGKPFWEDSGFAHLMKGR